MKNGKKERFQRLAEARTNKLIRMIRLLSNLSNKTIYSYTDDEIKKIFRAIDAEIKSARSKFSEKADNHFKL